MLAFRRGVTAGSDREASEYPKYCATVQHAIRADESGGDRPSRERAGPPFDHPLGMWKSDPMKASYSLPTSSPKACSSIWPGSVNDLGRPEHLCGGSLPSAAGPRVGVGRPGPVPGGDPPRRHGPVGGAHAAAAVSSRHRLSTRERSGARSRSGSSWCTFVGLLGSGGLQPGRRAAHPCRRRDLHGGIEEPKSFLRGTGAPTGAGLHPPRLSGARAPGARPSRGQCLRDP